MLLLFLYAEGLNILLHILCISLSVVQSNGQKMRFYIGIL